MRELKWPHVALVVATLAALSWLSYQGKDATTVLSGVFMVLGALGFGLLINKQSELKDQQTEIKQNTETIKDNTNGRISQMMQMLDQQARDHRREMSAMADKLATMVPAPLEPPVSGAGTAEASKGYDDPADFLKHLKE